jgi:hypothetical protein
LEEIGVFGRQIDTLHAQPVLILFLTLGMGYLIDGIRVGSFSLGPVCRILNLEPICCVDNCE